MTPRSGTNRVPRLEARMLLMLAMLLLPAAARSAGEGASEAAGATASASSMADTTRPVMFLREMLVTGSRYPRAYFESPQALSFLSRRQLRESLPAVTGDALSMLPGVDSNKDSPWEQRPSIRGLSNQRVMVLVDGNPMNSARGNGPHPSLVDPSQIERIEVVRGPSSFSYGSDALGGAINIITREALPGTGRSLKGGLTFGGSSAEKLRSVVGELSPRIGKFSAFLSGGGREAEDFRTPNTTVVNSAFRDYNWLANLRYDFSDRLTLKTGWQQYRARDAGLPGLSGSLPGYDIAFDFPFYNRDYAHVTLDHQYPNSKWINQTRVQFYWQREFRNFSSLEEIDASQFPTFGIFGAPPGSQTRVTRQDRYFDLDTYGFRTQLTSARTEKFRYTFGVDANRDQTDGDYLRFRSFQNAGGSTLSTSAVVRTAPVPDGRFDNYAGFLQGEWYLSPKLTMSGGGRFTQYRYRTDFGINQSGIPFRGQSRDDGALSGSLGLAYEVVPDLHLTTNVATGYREPNAQDLYFVGPASVGVVFGNDQLDPERSVSYDAGLRWGRGAFAVSGNLFYSTFDDLIFAPQLPLPLPPDKAPFVPPGQSAFEYTNIATATIWGGDLEAQARLLDRWTLRTQFSGQVGDITNREAILELYGLDQERVPLEQVPPFKGSTALRWTDPSGRFWAESGARWAWRTNRLPPSQGVSQLTAFKKEYIVGDLSVGAAISGHRLTLGVRNFTDRAYRPALASVEDPGLSFVGSLSTSF